MTRIRKILNDLATTTRADFRTPQGSQVVQVHDDQGSCYPIKLTIDSLWFSARDLRKTAKLFNKLADQLESEGRGA